MDPVQTVKSSLNPGKLIVLAIGLLGILALADLAGATDWILYPVWSFRTKVLKQNLP